MDANIESIVNDLKKVSVEKITFEAITNSIQANAKDISIFFYEKNKSLADDEPEYYTVDELKIIDNGDGFNDANIVSFKTYRSTYKKELGAKGIGRFLYLKLFKDVNITSLSKKINFTVQTDVDVQPSGEIYNTTTVTLSNPKVSNSIRYYQINKEDYKQQVKNHFLPYFKLLEEKNINIKIAVFFDDIEEYVINSDEIPCFKTESFKIGEHDFNLSYLLNDSNIQFYDGFYCADNRVVAKNSQLESKIKFKFFHGVNILFLLSSKYFDCNVNDERDEFNIKPVQVNQDMYSNLSWTNIQDALFEKIKEVCLQHGIDVEKEARESLQDSIDKAPFLAYYLSKNEYVLSSEELIKKAEKDYENEKQFLRSLENKSKPEYPVILNRVVQSELAEYIFDREKIINKLRSIVNDELLEKEVHNLFMIQRTEDSHQNYKSNHLWLFDDRFMTYDKIFSEIHIKTIFPELSDIADRLDLCIISNTYNKESITDIVIIELKRPSETVTSEGAEAQLLRYARYVNNTRQENKIRIWTYAFLKFNADIEESLKDKTYNKIPTHSKYPIYYRYYERANIIINFMDYSALADDAHTRNQTFINILKAKQYETF